jgi:hypothetical protein
MERKFTNYLKLTSSCRCADPPKEQAPCFFYLATRDQWLHVIAYHPCLYKEHNVSEQMHSLFPIYFHVFKLESPNICIVVSMDSKEMNLVGMGIEGIGKYQGLARITSWTPWLVMTPWLSLLLQGVNYSPYAVLLCLSSCPLAMPISYARLVCHPE